MAAGAAILAASAAAGWRRAIADLGGEENIVDIGEYLQLLKKRWRAITAITLLSVGVSLALAMLAQPLYRTQVAVFFSVAEGESFNDLAQGGMYSQRQVVS